MGNGLMKAASQAPFCSKRWQSLAGFLKLVFLAREIFPYLKLHTFSLRNPVCCCFLFGELNIFSWSLHFQTSLSTHKQCVSWLFFCDRSPFTYYSSCTCWVCETGTMSCCVSSILRPPFVILIPLEQLCRLQYYCEISNTEPPLHLGNQS